MNNQQSLEANVVLSADICNLELHRSIKSQRRSRPFKAATYYLAAIEKGIRTQASMRPWSAQPAG